MIEEMAMLLLILSYYASNFEEKVGRRILLHCHFYLTFISGRDLLFTAGERSGININTGDNGGCAMHAP